MKPTLFLSALLLLLHIITTRTQSPDDENKLYSEFLRINSTYTHSHVVSTDQIFWWSVSGTKIYIAVSGPGSDYVAAGFSPYGDMVGSVAVIGINSDIANISVYYLGGQSRSLVDHISSTNLVGSPVLTFLDGSLLLEFVWDTKGLNMHYNFSINDNVNMVWSWRSGFAYLDIHTGSTPSENPLNFQTGAGAKTYTTPKCGMGVPGNINGNVFQDPCQCRGFFQPPNCVKTNLTDTHTFYEGSTTIVTINWKVEKDIVNFDVLGDSDGWIGVGFCTSGAGKMANMEAVLGWVDKASGTGNVVAKYVKSNRNLSPNELLPLTSTSAWIIDGTMGMHFSRKLSDGYNPIINGTAFMVAAKQVTSRPLPIVQHSSHSDSGVEINLINGTVTIPPYIWLPEYTHALLMYIAWGILFPFGILFARYSKHIKRAMWFEIHRVTQTTGFMVTCCGTVVAMLMVDGSHFNTAWHAQLGTAALSVMIYQICSALLRPHVEPKHRKTCQRLIFEWTHHILGRMGVIAAWVNIFAGFQQLGLSNVFVYAHAGVVGFWSICLLQRPVEAIGISMGIHFILWYGAQLNFVTLLVLGLAAYVVGAWFVDVVSVVIPWEKWSQNDKKRGNNLSYPELIYEIIVLGEDLNQLWVSFQKARQKDPHKFTLYVTGILLIVAYLGSLVSGFVLVYVTVYILLLLPYMVIHQFHKRCYNFFEPYLPEVYEFLSSSDKDSTEGISYDSDDQTSPIDSFSTDMQIDSDLSVSSDESDPLELDDKSLSEEDLFVSSESDDLP